MINADDMQSWAYLLAPTFQFVNTAGKPLTEGYIEVYIAGTRNKYYCASDFNGTLHPFQIPLDSLGANIVLADPDQAYDVYVYNKYGSLVMSRYHVSPGMAGGSGVLSITITSEDGTVSVNNDGNGNFDLSIQDTVDRIDALEQAVSGLSADSSVGYAIAHAYTVELDGTFDLVNDAVTGIGYTPNMDGFRLKSGHVYQFNFNALFENGAFDRNCSGKLYLEGPNTIAQEWKFDLDDSYYHSQSINGSTVLVTPNDLNYYDVKLKLAWDVDYPNKPNVDLNKISIVDITTLLSTTVSGIGGNYTGGDGIFVNDETYVISVDMDYINSHLNIDATEIIASAVNLATAYTDARVTSVSGDLVNLIAEVSASIPTGIEQVQSDWNEQDSSSPAYIQHKPDLSVYATNASLTAVSSVLQSEIDAISGAIPTDYVTHNEVSAVSGNIIEYVNSVSGDLVETINNVSGDIIHTVESVSGDIIETVNNVSGDIIHTVETVSGDIIETITTVSGDIIETVNNVSGDIIHTVESVSGNLVEIIETATANIPEQVNADWEAVSGKAEILNKPDLSVYATHEEVSGVSAVLNERINNVSGDLIETITTVSGDIINTVETVSAVLEGDIVSAIQVATGAIPEQVNSDWNAVSGKAEILNKPDLSIYATHDELVDAVTAVSSMIPDDYVTHSEVSAVSANLVNYVNSVSGDITNYVDESIVSAINVATGSFEQVQSDWTEDDTNDPAYIQNKPNEIEIVAGQNIGIFSDASTITIAASATDLSDYATHSEISSVSGTLNTAIANKKDKQTAYSSSGSNTKTITNVSQNANGEISVTYSNISYPQQTPSVEIVSPSGTLNISSSTSGNTKTFSIDVAPTSGIEYGQFYATNITGAATMARTKGNIDITNDGKIKLKQGQSYHVTVRGRYNQSVLKDNYSYASYIEYVTNNSININVDESRSGSQYFELSYDLFKLNSDTDYYVFFTLDDATVNDLFIDIHSLANVGSNGSSGGSSPEYDAGYGIQILNNVISVSGIAPQVQSDWNQTNTSSVDYIKNKPEEYGLLAGDNISITASGNNFIISSTASAATGIDYQAGYGIDITGDTISVVSSIIPDAQINSDWTATSGKAEILNKPNESELIAGAGVSITASGSNYIISAVVTGSPVISGYVTEAELQTVSGNIVNQIPDVSNLATKTELATVSASIPDISGLATEAELQIVSAAIPDVSGFATVELVSAVSGKLPTTELGKFTIHSNVSGGPIEVICPTDQGFPIATVILDNNAVSGTTGNGTSSVMIVYKSPGYDNDYYSTEGSAILHIPAAVSGLYSLQLVYAPNSNPASTNGPSFLNPQYFYSGTSDYVLAAGDYDLNIITNAVPQTPGGYGKYITLQASGPAPDLQALLNSSVSLAVRHPELGITVNLDRYKLGNTSTTTNTSGLTQAVVYTDPTTKKQSVYLPSYAPNNWNLKTAVFLQYGSSSFGYSNADTSHDYIAYKYNSTTRNYEFAELVHTDYNAKKFTFARTYDGAIEYWIADCTNGYYSTVWSTETISCGSTYTAGTGIDITNDVISVDDTVITTGASGVSLPNAKFEIDTNGQAYKVVSTSTESSYGSWNGDGSFAYGNGYSLPTRNADGYGTLKAGTYRFTLAEEMNSIKVYVSGNTAAAYNGMVIPATNHVADLIITEDLTFIPYSQGYDWITINGYSNSDGTGTTYPGLWSNNSSAVYISPVVKEEYITETALTEAISAVTGAVVYQAGDYIGITDDTISVTGITDLVAGDNITITASGSSAIISATGGGEGDVTRAELASVSGTLETEIQVVSAALDSADIPTGVSGLVAGDNISLTASGSNYVISCTVTGDVTRAELVSVSGVLESQIQTVSAAIPTLADLNTQGITDIQVVQTLPAAPVSTVLYLIPET